MTYLPPYAVYGTHGMGDADVEREGARYERLLEALAADRVAWPEDDAPADGEPTASRVLTGDDVDRLLAGAGTGADAPVGPPAAAERAR
jgi:hypothetical protein